MQRGGWLLGFTALLGIGLFVAIFFLLPRPDQIQVPYFLKVALPQAADRRVPLPAPGQHSGITLSFVGDIMLARQVEQTIVDKGPDWPFAKLGDLFAGSDFVVGNFEGTVRAQRNIEVVNQMVFDTTPDNVAIVAKAGFTHLSLANNHADDYGQTTTDLTRQTILDTGMTPFGDPLAGEQFIARENLGGVAVSLIGFHAFEEKTEDILAAIQSEHNQGRFVIVYPHWGIEYADTASSSQTAAAQMFINAGADMIIGSHPHVIENVAVIGDVPVVYSLGNFLFDQDFSPETQQGLTVQVHITDAAIDLDFTPVSIENRQTFPMDATAAQVIFDKLGLPDGHLHVVRQQPELTQSAL